MSYFEEQERQRRDEPDDPGSAAAHHHREAMASHWDDPGYRGVVGLAEVVELRDRIARLTEYNAAVGAGWNRYYDGAVEAYGFALALLDELIAAASGEEE